MITIKILIFGGTGFIGERLIELLTIKQNEVVVMTRNIERAKAKFGDKVQACTWEKTLAPCDELNNVDVVINLTGESIGSGRWTKAKKEEILNSRVRTTRAIVDAIERGVFQPKTLINASAVGYYGFQTVGQITEDHPAGDDFLANVCVIWEQEARKAEAFGLRVAILRTGVVLGSGGGALRQMALPYKFFLGGPIGSGKQWMSWIHIDDLINIIDNLINNEHIEGPVNATAPNPVTMNEFSKTLGEILGKPYIFNVPAFSMKLLLGEMADMLVNGQQVIPKKLIDTGYDFKYPILSKALKEIFLD
ncbi:MAG: TIGR01777 family oxidoreductase [Vulcanibacillus sp.]